jgi:hypothetical protein
MIALYIVAGAAFIYGLYAIISEYRKGNIPKPFFITLLFIYFGIAATFIIVFMFAGTF